MSEALLNVVDLSVGVSTRKGPHRVVNKVSFEVGAGEAVAIVGESGSGKSVTALSVLGLRTSPAIGVIGGQVLFGGRDLLRISAEERRAISGDDIAMIFQDPMTYLNPVLTIERQIGEALYHHRGMRGKALRNRVLQLLNQVRIPDPERVARCYPHQLSGGMRQRVLIAGALACEPKLLIADEPTTALDATIQAQILDLLRDLIRELGISLALITHDMGVVANICQRVYVMKTGEVVESGSVAEVFRNPQHPYTQRLLAAVLRHDRRATDSLIAAAPARASEPSPSQNIVQVRELHKTYIRQGFMGARQTVAAVRGVSFDIPAGQTVAVVGESGSGKSTLGRVLINLDTPSSGDVLLHGRSIYGRTGSDRKQMLRQMQMIFQDPYSSLNPRKTIGHILGQPQAVHFGGTPSDYRSDVLRMLDLVGLPPEQTVGRMPHEFSGGQRQRIAIARALMLNPQFVVADEAVSALDVSIRAQVLKLLLELQRELNLTYLFISHDLGVVRSVAQTVAVMYRGEILEFGPVDDVIDNPQHPYSKALISAAFVVDPVAARAEG